MSLTNTEGLNFSRRLSCEVFVGDVPLGGAYPVRLQTMADVPTTEIEKAIEQTLCVAEAGAAYMRFTAQGVQQAKALGLIRSGLDAKGCHIPLVADIHFNPAAAFEALKHVEKVRINPGNFAELKDPSGDFGYEFLAQAHQHVAEVFGRFVNEAIRLGRAVRIGVNHGSLSQRMLRTFGNTPEGMVQSALEYLRICHKKGFSRVVISMKSSNLVVMTEAVRLLVGRMEEEGFSFPLHLGVTEAGESEDGRIKSAIGIGSLLADGIGDTIRVSLSEPPEAELPVARAILDHINLLAKSPYITSYSGTRYRRGALSRRNTLTIKGFIAPGLPPPFIVKGNKSDILSSLPASNDIILANEEILEQASLYLSSQTTRFFFAEAENLEALDLEAIKACPETAVVLLFAPAPNRIGHYRNALAFLEAHQINAPILLALRSNATSIDKLLIEAAIDFGTILLEGVGNGLYLEASQHSTEELRALALGILQATRLRFSHAEFISCPGCGRTLYNLQGTIAEIKAAFGHLSNLKIGVMGCIVNGPGEMADADYGYVGSTPGKIDLYKGQECRQRGVPQENATQALIELIKAEGDWQEP